MRFLLVVLGLTGCEQLFPLEHDGGAVDCLPPYTATQTGCYRVQDELVSFGGGELKCESDGGHLAVFSDQTEINVAFQFHQDAHPDSLAWIGLTATRTGEFQWVTKENAPVPPDMTPPWLSDEPGDAVTKPCVLLSQGAPAFDTFGCSGLTARALCEHDAFTGDPSRY